MLTGRRYLAMTSHILDEAVSAAPAAKPTDTVRKSTTSSRCSTRRWIRVRRECPSVRATCTTRRTVRPVVATATTDRPRSADQGESEIGIHLRRARLRYQFIYTGTCSAHLTAQEDSAMSTKAPRITDLDEDFAGDPLRHLARYCLPDHLVNLQGLAFVAGYNVDISSRLLDDGGLTYRTVVHRVTADGELHGSEYIIGMAEYHGAGWTMIPQGTGTLPDAAVGVEVAVRRTPITSHSSHRLQHQRLGLRRFRRSTAGSAHPCRTRRAPRRRYRRPDHRGGNRPSRSRPARSTSSMTSAWWRFFPGFDVEVKNRLVGDDHECTLTARRVDQDGDPVGQAIVVVSAYRNGEWTIDRSRTGILEGDAALRPADTGELVNFLFERINDWDLADEFMRRHDRRRRHRTDRNPTNGHAPQARTDREPARRRSPGSHPLVAGSPAGHRRI